MPLLDATSRGQACELAALGLNGREVARRLGCSPRTPRRERLRNSDFGRLYHEAEAATLARPLEALRRHARTSWRAAAWLLERTDPQRFASRRPAACRPERVEQTCRQLVEVALEAVDFSRRTRLYAQLRRVSDECIAAIVHSTPANQAVFERPKPTTDLESMVFDMGPHHDVACDAAASNPDTRGQLPVEERPQADSSGQPSDARRTARSDNSSSCSAKNAPSSHISPQQRSPNLSARA